MSENWGDLFPGAWYDLSCRGKGFEYGLVGPYRLISYVCIEQLQRVSNMLEQHLRSNCKSKNNPLRWILMCAKALD